MLAAIYEMYSRILGENVVSSRLRRRVFLFFFPSSLTFSFLNITYIIRLMIPIQATKEKVFFVMILLFFGTFAMIPFDTLQRKQFLIALKL